MLVAPESVEAQIKATRFSSQGIFEEAGEGTGVMDKPSVSVRAVENTEREHILTFKATLDSTRLTSGALYRFEVLIGPRRREVTLPDWVKEWDMSSLPAGAVSAREGAKTLNLEPFVWNLWNGMTSSASPELARAYFYIRKD
jgi:hypothetical protein